MEKIIEIDLNNKYDFIDKYNEKKLSNEILEYIIRQARPIKNHEKIKIILNNKCDIEKDCTKLLKEGLKAGYDRSLEIYHYNNKKQLWLLCIGIVLLFLSSLIKQDVIWKEILLISGWVPIWEMVKVELFPDIYGRKKRKLIKKLLSSEIIVKEAKT